MKKYGFENMNKYGFENMKKSGFENTTSQSLNRIALIEAIIGKKEIEQSQSYIVCLFLYRQLMKALFNATSRQLIYKLVLAVEVSPHLSSLPDSLLIIYWLGIDWHYIDSVLTSVRPKIYHNHPMHPWEVVKKCWP